PVAGIRPPLVASCPLPGHLPFRASCRTADRKRQWGSMFNWNDLVFFLELARQGRLMPAARRLKVDHTTVSRRISELEKDLAIKIFDRKPNGFVLTEDGHKLYQEAEKIEGAALVISEDFRATPTE